MSDIVPINAFSEEIADDLKHSSIPLDYATQVLKIYPHPVDPINQYIIPYFHLDGSRIHNYFRIKLLKGAQSKYQQDPPKYLSPPGSSNHLYIPPDFIRNFKRNGKYFVITEGEKKAASISRLGFPCVGLPGIDSWRTSRFTLKGLKVVNLDELQKDPNTVPIIELPDSASVQIIESRVVPELAQELFTFLRNLRLRPTIYLVFDRDPATHPTTVENVARALFELSFWLQQQHFEDIWSINLPIPPEFQTQNQVSHSKVGLDDFVTALLQRHDDDTTRQYIHDLFTTLDVSADIRYKPHPHNIRYWIQSSLEKKTLSRQDKVKVARALINGLDNLGQRFYDDTQTRFYFLTHETKEVFEFTLSHLTLRDFHQHPFGQYLNRTFSIGSADSDTLIRMANLYTTTGSQSVVPRRVSHSTVFTNPQSGRDLGVLYIQLNDSTNLKITGDDIITIENGTDGQLFISNLVETIDPDKLQEAILDEDTDHYPNWFESLEQTTIQPIPPFNREETVAFIGCLFYIAPWFRRFRGLQLPIEMAIAEPGSGKSFLYKLRQGILTGIQREQSVPQHLRDWYTSVTNGSDLWVGDNVNALPKDLKSVLADELCRITTSESPSITIRQLYTTNTVARLEIPCTFAFTAINNPFLAEDFVQRAVFMHFEAIKSYDADWVNRQLRPHDSGREKWLAHMIKVSQRFIRLTDHKWDPEFKSSHRLMHFEQSLYYTAHALHDIEGISPKHKAALLSMSKSIKTSKSLERITTRNVEDVSPVLQALKIYSQNHQRDTDPYNFVLREVVDWVSSNHYYEFGNNDTLGNPIVLGRYIGAHASDVSKVSGIKKLGKQIRHTPAYTIMPKCDRDLNIE